MHVTATERRVISLLVIALVALLTPVRPAFACSCMMRENLESAIDQGTVTAVVAQRVDNEPTDEFGAFPEGTEATFRILRSYGAPPPGEFFTTPLGDSAGCGLSVPPGGLLAVAVDRPGRLDGVGLCSSVDLAALVARETPEQSAAPPVAVFATASYSPNTPQLGTLLADGTVGSLIEAAGTIGSVAACDDGEIVNVRTDDRGASFLERRSLSDLSATLVSSRLGTLVVQGYPSMSWCDGDHAVAVVTFDNLPPALVRVDRRGEATTIELPAGVSRGAQVGQDVLLASSGFDDPPVRLWVLSASGDIRELPRPAAIREMGELIVRDDGRVVATGFDADYNSVLCVVDPSAPGPAGPCRANQSTGRVVAAANGQVWAQVVLREGVLLPVPDLVRLGPDLRVLEVRRGAAGWSLSVAPTGTVFQSGDALLSWSNAEGVTESTDPLTGIAQHLAFLPNADLSAFGGLSADGPGLPRVALLAASSLLAAIAAAGLALVVRRRQSRAAGHAS